MAGNAEATVSWTLPGSGNTGSAGPDDPWLYQVKVFSGGSLVMTTDQTYAALGTAQSTVVTGLTNGLSYTFKAVAKNGPYAGPWVSSPDSAASNAVTPVAPPPAPTNVSAVAGSGEARVSWTLPGSGNTGSAGPLDPWLYQVKVYSGGSLVMTTDQTYAALGTAQSTVVTGLTNGVSYTFKAVAKNGPYAGPWVSSPDSAASNAVTPFAAPLAPTNVSAVAGNAQATVSWTLPGAGNTGSAGPIDPWLYQVKVYSGGSLVRTTDQTYAALGTAQSTVVTGLTNGVSYTFKAVAKNGQYAGPWYSSPDSAASNAVTPMAPPPAPTNVSAVAGNAQATVSWTLPGSGNTGSAGAFDPWLYQIKVFSGGSLVMTTGQTYAALGTAQSAVVSGLTNGVSYTFKVVAKNGPYAGPWYPSPDSAASNAVTPHL